jgi:hypothetical protein
MDRPNATQNMRTGSVVSTSPVAVKPSGPERWPSWKTHTTAPTLAAIDSRKPRTALRGTRTEQRQGEVREGPLERIGVPVFATLHGYADLAATGMLAPQIAERGLDEVIAFILRGCAPDPRP